MFVMLHTTITVLFIGFGRVATAKLGGNALHALISFLDNDSIRKRPQKTEEVVDGTC